MSNFKIGDWVKFISNKPNDYCDGEILQITNIDDRGFCHFGDYNKLYSIDLLELWQPKEGEWCWFYNSDNYDSVQLTLGKFYGISSKELKYTYIDMDRQEYSSECCEPFIPGKFPSIIKEKQ